MKQKVFLINIFLLLAVFAGAQQCRSFVKKNCMPDLGSYTPNETFNSAVLIPGDEAELNMTFYAGQEYRMFVCNDEIIGDVNYRVLDADKKEVFN